MPSMPTKLTKKVQEEPVIEPEFEYMEEAIANEGGTFTFKRSHFYAVVTVFAFAAGILLGYVVWGFDSAGTNAIVAGPNNGPVVEAPVEDQPQFVRYDIASKGFYGIGPEDAPITIVEFSDYQCPFCKRWHDEVYQDLLNEYPGQIRLVYRPLPLTSIHPEAFPAAEAAMCAGEQNAYWPFHEMLFSTDSLGSNIYFQYAQELGLDLDAFEACVAEHRYQEAVQTDLDFAVGMGVRSTPTFFINGLAVVGAQPLNVFKQVIDKELAGEIPQ